MFKENSFLAFVIPRLPMSVHKKIKLIWFSRLAGGYRHTNVLFHYMNKKRYYH